MADFIERGQQMMNDPATVARIRQMSQATGYHPTYIAAWLDVENAQTPEERANRAAMMSRAPGDAFEQYSGNSQRQYETAQQMENSRLDREHRTTEREAGEKFRRDERIAGEEFTKGERIAGQKFQKKNRNKTLKGQRKNIKLDDRLGREREQIAREGRQEDQKRQNEFETDRDLKLHGFRMDELDVIHGTGPSAFKQMQENKAELMAAPPSPDRLSALRMIDAKINPGEDADQSLARIREEQQPYYAEKFQDGTVQPGNLPLGLQMELKQIVGEKDNAMSYEDFCDYLDIDVSDPGSDAQMKEFYLQVTGNKHNHDHWFY